MINLRNAYIRINILHSLRLYSKFEKSLYNIDILYDGIVINLRRVYIKIKIYPVFTSTKLE